MKQRNLLVFIFTAFFTHTAFAEYYIAEPSCSQPVYTIYSSSHHHHYKKVHHATTHHRYYSTYAKQRNSYQVTVTYYYPAPTCGCAADAWVPGHCQCGHWQPAHWQSQKEYVGFEARPVGQTSYHETFYTQPSLDRATRDDNQPDMEIN